MAIIIKNLNYIYGAGTVFEKQSLKDINLTIEDGEFIGIIGYTGSGKSTLIQHLNGLNVPASGTILYNGEDIYRKGYSKKKLRSKVGLVFQYPEYQLFETTVLNDVKFGPKNIGMTDEETDRNAKEALKMVGISENMYDVSPLELSGGEKRRVAIAGVIAMKPEVLVLDEPTAGLDPKGKNEILSLIDKLHKNNGVTIVLVSHSMEDVAKYATRIVVMNDGEIFACGTPCEVFRQYKELEKIGLSAPQTVYLLNELKSMGYDVDTDIINPDEAVKEILIHMAQQA